LALNESPFAPSDQIAAVIKQSAAVANCYGNPACTRLVNAISETYAIPVERLICGNGSEELLEVVARTFVQRDDEIVLSQYGYIVFEMIARRLNARLVKAPESNYVCQADALLDCITSSTRLIFLANPNNPTGTMMSVAQVQQLLQALPNHIVLVIDLAYGEFVGFDYCEHIHKLVADYDNVVVTRTFSKAFSLAGLRVGWAHAPAWMIPGLYAARGMGTVNALAQAAAVVSLQELVLVREQVRLIRSECQRITDALENLGVRCIASETNFLLMTIVGSSRESTEALVDFVFDNEGILITLAREAGLERFFRVSVSTIENNNRLISAVERFLEQCKELD